MSVRGFMTKPVLAGAAIIILVIAAILFFSGDSAPDRDADMARPAAQDEDRAAG